LLKEVNLADKIILLSSVPVCTIPPASNIRSIEIISCFTVGALYRILISSENYFLSLHAAVPLVIPAVSWVGYSTNKNDHKDVAFRSCQIK
jgi:hypothetical protein